MSPDKQKGARDAGKREAAQTEQPIIGEYLSFAATEAYKLLRTNLMFALPDQGKCRVVGVTSALRNEGKSTLAINLAYTVAQAGYRVLLIDGDMRLPTLAKRLNIPKRPGLSNLLAGLCTVQDAVQTSDLLDNLKAIAAGDIPPNPSELLASARMETLLRELGADYDFILLDLPPVTAVTDGLVISKLVDGMIVVVCRGYCEKKLLEAALRNMKYLNIKILGFVMTRGSVDKSGYGKRYGKYKKGYGGYYSYGAPPAGGPPSRSRPAARNCHDRPAQSHPASNGRRQPQHGGESSNADRAGGAGCHRCGGHAPLLRIGERAGPLSGPPRPVVAAAAATSDGVAAPSTSGGGGPVL